MGQNKGLKSQHPEKTAGPASNPADALADIIRMQIINNACGVDADYQFTREVQMVEMDDGVRLETFIWKPVGKGPWPTAFTRGPYPDMMESVQAPQAEEFAKRGIAYVYQNCRGKGGSQGVYVANVDERRDGIASLNWLNTQDWVASIGIPATGIDAYVVGEDKWLHLEDFPMKTGRALRYYLTADPIGTNGKATALSVVKPVEQSVFSYTYDPSDPKWAEGGECFLTSCAKIPDSRYSTGDLRGSHELSVPGYRQDVISFVSPPLAEAVTLAGNLKAALFVSSDAEDTAFTYTISEVDENGAAHNIRNGLLTLAYRHDRYASPVNDYRPGQVVELDIESLPIVWMVDAGHRIRVDISSSNFPEFSNHTNTVGNWAEQTGYQIAHQTIFAGGSYASSITLPILGTE